MGFLCPQNSYAQQFGGIRGQVVDSDFGQPIGKATVTILDTPFGAMTDDQGNFTISGVPPGIYTLQTRASGYIPKTVPEVSVAAGSFNDLRLEAVAEIEELEELVVPGEIEKASETGLLAERQEATAVMDMIGQDFISRLGAANAGDAMKRMVGTSVVDGKYVAVRGMPDRYVNTLLNGGRLPSTDPDKRAINVDLFPGSILESINTYKTFTPDQPGDFTGGSVDIRTKTFPDKPSFGTGVTMEYNSQTTFNPNFLTYNGGGTGPFGGKANGRMIPDSVNQATTQFNVLPKDLTGGNPADLQAADTLNSAMRQMNPVIGLTNKTPPPNMSFNLQGGDSVELGPSGEKVGIIGAFSYRNKYSYFGNGVRGNLYLEDNGNPKYFEDQQLLGKQDVLWGALTGLSGQWDENNKVSLNVMYNLGADDIASQRSDDQGSLTQYQQIIDYGERSLGYLQLVGENRIEEARNLKINWNGGLGQATLSEPDQRQFTYNLTDAGEYRDAYETSPAISEATNLTLERFQRELTEGSYYSIVDFTVPMLEEKERTDAFKTGFYADYSQREYTQQSYVYPYGMYGFGTPNTYTRYTPTDGSTWADVFLNPDRSGLVDPTAGIGQPMMSYTVYNLGGNTNTSTGTFYNASQAVTASYLMADFNLFPQLRLTGGTRFENTNLKIKGANNLPAALFPDPNFSGGKGTGLAKIQQLDLLPGVGATFNLMENVNLRFAWSQTLARPSFKEMGPVLTKNFTEDEYFVGNPALQLSKANNYDFRAEWFPRAGEVLAVSLFYKNLLNPMEQQAKYSSKLLIDYLQYDNAPNGIVYGLELEARKRLDQIASCLKNFSLYFNYSQIQSSVPLPSETVQVLQKNGQSTANRPLQGQPEYIINAGLNYDNEEYKFYAGLYFNVTGPFLYAVGTPSDVGLVTERFEPDIYEMPAPSLDFNLTQGLTDNWKLTFRGKNLLNPFFNRTQTYNGVEYIYSSYTRGWDLSLNASYSF